LYPTTDSLVLKIVLARALIRLLSLLPLWLLHGLAVPLGWLINRVPSRRRTVIDTNIGLAFPELSKCEKRRLRQQNLIEMTRLVLESGAVWYWSKKRILAHVPEVSGWEHVEAAQRRGKGYMLVSGHLGNWEILNLYASIRQPMACLYKAPADDRINRLITASRQRFGGRLIASGSPAMRQIVAQLRNGGGIGLLFDQQPKQGEGVFAPLFGTAALTMTLVNRLVRRSDCAILMLSCRRLPHGRGWALTVSPADERIASADPVTAIACLHDWLEEQIRLNPAQYLWSYKRYSIRPPGQAPIYPARR
jgi:Kdo2-lipid IVA lauroyltransferase/acyltransferase